MTMTDSSQWQLQWLPGQLAVCRLPATAAPPDLSEFTESDLVCLTRTKSETSLVINESEVPPGAKADAGWHALRVVGTIPFETIGLLATLTGALAQSGISVFAVSTFDTDYLLVKDRAQARECLIRAGYRFLDFSTGSK